MNEGRVDVIECKMGGGGGGGGRRMGDDYPIMKRG